MSKDYYKILGVDKSANSEEIKKAYYQLARKYHPDRTGGKTSDQFAEINEAYETLSDSSKRSMYDNGGFNANNSGFGAGGFNQGFGQGFGSQGYDFGGGGFDFEDLFGFFGGAPEKSKRNSAIKGEDIVTHTNITLEEAFKGLKINFKYDRKEFCTLCGKTCTECRGTGTKISSISSGFTTQHTYSKCRKCDGKGKESSVICKNCKGIGFAVVTKNLEIIIPQGIEDQQVITYKDMGHGGFNGGGYGNLNLFVKIQEHSVFKRIGVDLKIVKNVSLCDLIIGNEFIVDGIDGEKIKVKIKPGTQIGEEIKITEKGMKRYNSFLRGNLIIEVKSKVPAVTALADQDILSRILRSVQK